MRLTTAWRRQATKAAALAALAPAVLLGAAVLLAAGAGFGGLSSLAQVADGPSVPEVEQAAVADRDRPDAESAPPVVALAAPAASPDTSAAARRGSAAPGRAGAPPTRSNAPVSRPQGSQPGTPGGRAPGTSTPTRPPAARTPAPSNPSAPSTPSAGTSPTPPQQAPITPVIPQPQPPSAPNPVQNLLDLPRQLPAPVGPLTDRVLNTILPPR